MYDEGFKAFDSNQDDSKPKQTMLVSEGMEVEKSNEEKVVEIAQGSSLSNDQLQAALLDAIGVGPQVIAGKFGKNKLWIYQMRAKNPEYKRVVMEFYGLVAGRVVEEVGDFRDLFNMQVGPSAKTLIEVRDNIWAKDGDRIKAALAFLDRAPDAPKAVREENVRQMVVQIPVEGLREMERALEDEGGERSLRILEGKGGGGSKEEVIDVRKIGFD